MTNSAAIIVEPFQRLIPPAPGFLQGLRDLATHYDIPLIFDEVVTGFRFAYGGAQDLLRRHPRPLHPRQDHRRRLRRWRRLPAGPRSWRISTAGWWATTAS